MITLNYLTKSNMETLEDLNNFAENTEHSINKVHRKIWKYNKLELSACCDEFKVEDVNGCCYCFTDELNKDFDVIKGILLHSIAIDIELLTKEAILNYQKYLTMCENHKIQPKKFNLDFTYSNGKYGIKL